MNTRINESHNTLIDFDLFLELFNLTPSAKSDNISSNIKQRLMKRVASESNNQFFIFEDQGAWKTIGPGLSVKLLQNKDDNKSFLLKLSENTIVPYHDHNKNEETFVIEGEVWLDGVFCKNGDYHYASAGTFHKEIRTEKGCMLFIKTS